jgi:O-antigen/teichoic acid export membrane protein
MSFSFAHVGDRLRASLTRRVWQVVQSLWASMGIQVFLLGSGILVARVLGPSGRGNLALALILPSVGSQVVCAGVPSAATYFMAKNRGAWRVIVRRLLPVVVLQSALAMLLVVALDYGFLVGRGVDVRLIAILTAGCVPFIVGEYYGLAVLQGLNEIRLFNICRMGPSAVYTVGLAAFFVLKLTVIMCVAIWVGSQVITTVALLAILIVRSRAIAQSATDGAPSRSVIVRFGVTGFLAQVSPVETFRVDQLLVAAVFPPPVLGYYAVAYSVSNMPRFVADGIVAVGYPHVSEQNSREGRSSARRYLLAAVFLCGGSALVVSLALPWLIPFLFGQRFQPAVVLGVILLLASSLVSIRRVGSDCLRALGEPGISTAIEIATWVVLGLGFLAIGSLGAGKGVALSLAMAAAVGLGLTVLRLRGDGRVANDGVVSRLHRYRRAMNAWALRNRPPAVVVVVILIVVSLTGIFANHLAPVAVGLAALLPLVSHVRWVGWRRALTEPSVPTIIVIFYVFVFPLRALVIVASHFTDVQFAHQGVTSGELTSMVLLASAGTTVLVEVFHFARQWPRADSPAALNRIKVVAAAGAAASRIVLLATIAGAAAIVALLVLVAQSHGLSGAQAKYLSHSKELIPSGGGNLAMSVWTTVAVPSVWCATCAVIDGSVGRYLKLVFVAMIVVILSAEIVVFGSRLDVLLGLVGVWIVLYYAGRTIPVTGVLAAVLIILVGSAAVVGQRAGGEHQHLPIVERYSRLAGYSVLDASLTVRQEPAAIRPRLEEASRWFDAPLYLVPSAIWPHKPNLNLRRMDLYVAQTIGDQNQQNTGFPTTYITEAWLYGGWLGVLIVSALVGFVLGRLHRRLVPIRSRNLRPAFLLWYCFVLSSAFSYYKDGDVLMSAVSILRVGVYFALAMLITGVWSPFGDPAVTTRTKLELEWGGA